MQPDGADALLQGLCLWLQGAPLVLGAERDPGRRPGESVLELVVGVEGRDVAVDADRAACDDGEKRPHGLVVSVRRGDRDVGVALGGAAVPVQGVAGC